MNPASSVRIIYAMAPLVRCSPQASETGPVTAPNSAISAAATRRVAALNPRLALDW